MSIATFLIIRLLLATDMNSVFVLPAGVASKLFLFHLDGWKPGNFTKSDDYEVAMGKEFYNEKNTGL